ncbi:hypothetical protein GCM10010174_14120 [Kutzneria viridogrisea]|uniref:Multidrug resistance protein MdtA-like C-terminal permuted SH3 domain-containing protein n=1 Tax=Kutzneria viridogrisea TaxID=47990 RepID=A0ABR6BH73_9PSEU|nr:hypothetical protein [Kutzneria viridogrisea]
MPNRVLLRCAVFVLAGGVLVACSEAKPDQSVPELAQRGKAVTTAKPVRQDLANKVSLTGKVALDPVFGLVAPVDGQIRYLDVKQPESTPTTATRVANIWASGVPHPVEVPAGATFAGRLVEDKSTVTAGMPIASAKRAGYGVVAELDGAQAYRISSATASVQAQIKDGPGPFPCTALGTIAALPGGTMPEPPAPPQAPAPPTTPGRAPITLPPPAGSKAPTAKPSEPTGLRLVCTAPEDVKLINGAAVTLEVVTERAQNALVVPVEAVAGTQGKGKVDVVAADGHRETREVVLGLTDGKVVEVKSGLTGEETLGVPGPNLPAAPQNGQPGGPTAVGGR